MDTYAVVICDIIKSRSLKRRAEAQDAIDLALREINQRYREFLAIPFQFTLGDEFQGVLRDHSKAPLIAARFREEIAPLKIRVAIGIGAITTALSDDIRKVDGPAFYAARDAMRDLLSTERDGLKQRRRLTALRTEAGRDEVVDTVFTLYDTIISGRTEKQWWVAKAYDQAGSVTRASEIFGTTVQNISKLANAARLAETESAERFLERYLSGEFRSMYSDK